MERNSQTKNIVLGVLLVAVVTLSIAYAALSATLSINAQATVKGANWNVKFREKSGQTNLCTITKGSASSNASFVTGKTGTISDTVFNNLAVNFSVPGDKVVCTWEVANLGDFDAKLTTFTKGTPSSSDPNVTSNIEYKLTYDTEDGTPVAQNNLLPHGSSNVKTLVLTIGYKSTATYIPASDVAVTGLTATLVYTQN